MMAPPPTAVRYNDWRGVAVPPPEDFVPERPVSVIVPCYEASGPLALTLAGLQRQDWPRELLEVLVVDDGSEPPLERPAGAPPDLKIVRQPRRGFGLARARNLGARAAAHGILVFLDGDVIPEAGLIRAHARWHHAVGDALTLGFCAYVSAEGVDAAAVRARRGSLAELFAGRPHDPPWLERHMTRTADLTSRHADLFRAVTGHNFGISRALFEDAGGFDASFARYGGEDTEFAYRAQVRGALLVPERAAFGWHQGRFSENRQAKECDMDRQAPRLAELIAEPEFRAEPPGRPYAVPRVVVTLPVGREPAEAAVRAAETLLADPAGDLAVCIEAPPGRGELRRRLERRFARDPRVAAPAGGAGALDAFPASPIHVIAPVAAVLGWGPSGTARRVARLAAGLGDAARARAVLEDGAELSAVRAWALNRARRAGGEPGDYGDTRTLPGLWFKGPARPAETGPSGPCERRSPARRGVQAVAARVWAEARHVRGPRTAWRFLGWLAAAARWRLRQGVLRSEPQPPRPAAPASGGALPDRPLGARIAAFGPRSRAAFAASSQVLATAPAPGETPPDAVLADTAQDAAGLRAPAVLVSDAPELAVPAFDPALDNPVGWVRDVQPKVLALGPPAHLPPGARARRAAAPGDRAALLHCHHIEDIAAFHDHAAARAGTLARLAARGVPVHLLDRDPALAPLLGAELFGLMRAGLDIGAAAEREAASIAQRRAALRAHSLEARARQVCQAAGATPPPLPTVSVLLATRRPALLDYAVASVARQRYPRLELVLALHGPGFEPRAVDAALEQLAHPRTVLRLEAARPLGEVLAATTAAADGALLAKMDDDDAYGPEHLWDLALAHGYSGASLVGKFPATVYLARSNRTVQVRWVPAETWSASVTGGTLLIAPDDLERAGGWRAAPRHVDEALVDDVLRAGGTVYRTHAAGYVLVRHGDRHTWRRADAAFLADAGSVREGWPGDSADLPGVPPPPVADGRSAPPSERPARV